MKFVSIEKKLQFFSTKLLALAILAMVMMAFTTGYLLNQESSNQLSNVISKSLITKGHLQLLNVSSRLPMLLEDNSFSEIEGLFTSILQNDSDFIYVNYIDLEGKKWLNVDLNARKVKLDIKPSNLEIDTSKNLIIIKTDSLPIYQFVEKIYDSDNELLGYCVIDVSTESMIKAKIHNQKILQATNIKFSLLGIVVFSILLILIGFIFSKRFAKSFIKPLNNLENSAKLIASGNYNEEVVIETDDELGQLAQELEHMRITIQENHKQMAEMLEESKTQLDEINRINNVSTMISNFQNNEIEKIKNNFQYLADGDLTIKYKVDSADNNIRNVYESFVELSNNFNISIEKLSNLIIKIQELGVAVRETSLDIEDKYGLLENNFDDIDSRSINVRKIVDEVHEVFNSIVDAVAEISTNIDSVNNETKQMTDNMNSVKNYLEQIISIIDTMSSNFKEVVSVSSKAVEESNIAQNNILEMEKSANDISKVTDIIKKIAGQTNLLALNATIEAASAGEAGKGFAVVANEIKELAKQSAKAAENIYSNILEMQNNTSTSVQSIKNVNLTIVQIKESSQNVSSNVSELTNSSNMISEKINNSVDAIDRIANAIEMLNNSSNEVTETAEQKTKRVDEMKEDMEEVINSINIGKTSIKTSKKGVLDLVNISTTLKSLLQEFKTK